MSNRRLLGFVWLALAVVVFLVLRDLSGWAFGQLDLGNREFLGRSTKVSDLVGAVLTIGIALGSWRHPKAYEFGLQTVEETRKVVWPTRKETRDQTLVVVAVSVVMSLMLWGFDQVWRRLFSVILNLGA